MKKVVGRFAPSPTGPLHFGSLVAAVGSYCLARQADGLWLLRMEDLDTPRVIPGAADQILRSLEQFGLFWDGSIIWQSQRGDAYQAAIEVLQAKSLVFECTCSRKEVLASAPHPGEDGPVYPGTCRAGLGRNRRPRALRIKVPGEQICFCDGVFGDRAQVLRDSVGDFVLRRADGLFAYQLAVVVDDAASDVNQVVRGADLLSSTPRQIYLHSCLGQPVPDYIHLPLVTDSSGQKISKRHGGVDNRWPGGLSGILCRALNFLGQSVPADFNGAATTDIVAWAVQHFDVKRIPAVCDSLKHDSEKNV